LESRPLKAVQTSELKEMRFQVNNVVALKRKIAKYGNQCSVILLQIQKIKS